MSDYSYLGVGKIYLREVGAAAGLIEVGNCSALTFNVTEETRELRDYTQAGGGTYNEVKRISAVEMSFTAHDLSPGNLARALYGESSSVATATVSAEAHTAYPGSFIKTDSMPSTITSVTGPAGTPAYTEGTDFEKRGGGILVIEGGAITSGADIEINYEKAATDVIQAIVNSGKEYEIVFDGLNEARSGKKTVVHVYRSKLGATQSLNLIGEEYASLEQTGKLLKDTSKTGAGISQYFKTEIEQ